MTRERIKRRGVTATEIIIIIVCCFVALVLILVALVWLGAAALRGARSQAVGLKDGTQIREIHQSMIIFASEFEGDYPRPGLLRRLPVDIGTGDLQRIPGRGAEDITQNTTANLYSMMIMHSYFGPDLVVSPMEPSARVFVRDDYNWDRYNPTTGVYWDPAFLADPTTSSNASYAHMPLFGERLDAQWRETIDSEFAILGNRGPRGGIVDPNSITCENGQWSGNVCFNDNYVQFFQTMTPKSAADNIFAMEEGPGGGDAILSFTKTMSEDGPELMHD